MENTLLKNRIQVGVIGVRDPEDRTKIIENVLLYAESTPEHKEQSDDVMVDIANIFKDKFKEYLKNERKEKPNV